MKKTPPDYMCVIKDAQQVKISVHLENGTFTDARCLVRLLEGTHLTLELCEAYPYIELGGKPGAEVFITIWTGWSLFQCSAVLMQKIQNRLAFLQLGGPMVQKENREHFRLDVSIPFCFMIPELQLPPAVQSEWSGIRELICRCPGPVLKPCKGGFEVIKWNGCRGLMPRWVNLSGGGFRFKSSHPFSVGTLVAVNLFLPLMPPRVIHAVAEVLRCNEVLLSREKGAGYVTAMRFHFINEKDRDTIIAYIFHEQRRQLNLRVSNQF